MYRLQDDAASKLRDLLYTAARRVREPIESQERLISDLYAGRDANQSGLLASMGSYANLPVRDSQGSWTPPELGVNLMLSRLQQIVAGTVPSKPTFYVQPRLARAVHEADAQNKISQFASDHGKLRAAMKRAAFQGMMAPYFCVKWEENPDARGKWEKVRYRAIEARDCGYEPKHRRFTWHTQVVQFSDVPERLRKSVENQPQPWDLVRFTQVWHPGFRHGHKDAGDKMRCPVSYYLTPQVDESEFLGWRDTDEAAHRDFGEYVYSENVPACPLAFGSFNEPAPGEDVAPVEVVTWLPHIRKIVQHIAQIHREVRSLNTVELIRKGAVSKALLDDLSNNGIPSEKLFVEVDVDDSEQGVNATWRPVEQSNNLNELLSVLQTDLALFDDAIGLSPMERGIAQNPRKSATEAQSITAASSRRSRERLEVIAAAFSDLHQIGFAYQKDVYGDYIDVPGSNGTELRLQVPDPTHAQFSFEVDPVELGHLSKQGDADALFNGVTVLSNTLAMFQGALPKPIREMLRRLMTAQGVPDADALIDRPALDTNPSDRFQEYLLHGTPMDAQEQDDHQAFVGYYSAQLSKKSVQFHGAQEELARAIAGHNVYLRRQAAQRIEQSARLNPVEGVTQNGLDNEVQVQVDAGEPPSFPQKQGF